MDFSKFFSNFESQESIAILFFLIVAFLLGFIAGYLARSGTVRRLKRELEEKQKALAAIQAEIPHLQEQLSLKEADLRKAQFEVEENKAKVTRLAEEKAQLYNEIYSTNADIEKLQISNKAYLATIEDLNNQILGLKAKQTQLAATPEKAQEPLPDESAADYIAQFQSTQNALRSRLEALEGKIGNLESENKALKTEVTQLKSTASLSSSAVIITAAQPEWVPQTTKTLLQKPPAQTAETKDDLTKIEGIGPFLEKKLNEIGVYNYEQISQWDAADINQITEQIAYFPGRIERDDWVGQAIKLMRLKRENPDAFVNTYPTDHTDLKIVEGIGPKIETLLKEAGILTWEDLSEARKDQLDAILDAAGDHYRIHDPTTWPVQAGLAANNNWELLHEYQEQLKGGREVQ